MSNGKGEVIAPQDGGTTEAKEQAELAKPQVEPAGAIPPKNPATFPQKVALSAYLLALSIVSLHYINETIDKVNVDTLSETSTSWELPNWATLKGAPASFHYDAAQERLVHRGPISADKKLQLRDLLELQSVASPDSPKPTPAASAALIGSSGQTDTRNKSAKAREAETKLESTEATASSPASGASVAVSVAKREELRKSYNSAIDRLAYLAAARQGAIIQHVLLLGLFGGALGAVLRSLVDFVGHACYTRQLDLVVWWPLYFTRPIVGGILGYVLVVLFKARLLTSGDIQPSDDSFWWLGVAVIGGFSTVDVTLRLRVAAKALFGVESSGK